MKKVGSSKSFFFNFNIVAPVLILLMFVSVFFRGIIQNLLFGIALAYFLFFLGYILFLNLELHFKKGKKGRFFFLIYVVIAILMFVFALNSVIGFLRTGG